MSEPVVRVGVLGLGDTGCAYVDALRTQPGCSLAGAWDVDAERRTFARRLMRVFESADELVRCPKVDVALCADLDVDPRVLEAALAAGKHLALEPGVVAAYALATRLAAAARAHRRAIVALNPACREDDFRAAAIAIGRPELGALRRVDFRLWSPPPIADRTSSGRARDAGDGWPRRAFLLIEGAARIDQLARLVPDEPDAIFCDVVEPGARAAHSAGSFLEGGALFLQVRFQAGVVARIDVDRRTCLTAPATWTLSGAMGGFTHGRLHQTTDEGEVFETPWQPPPPTENSLLPDLTTAPRTPTVDPHWTRAARILEAAIRSAREGRVVRA